MLFSSGFTEMLYKVDVQCKHLTLSLAAPVNKPSTEISKKEAEPDD